VNSTNNSGFGSNHILTVTGDGDLKFIHDDRLVGLMELGGSVTRRASNVEFNNDAGCWEADMSPSGHDVVLSGFKLRSEALAAEKKYLEDNVL